MRVIPEINIMNGHCVKQGLGNNQYYEMVSHSPRKIAKMWEEQDANYLHIRDLDGLINGNVTNQEAIAKLINAVTIPVEVYSGVYSLKEVENMLHLGADRIVIGLSHTNLNFVREAVNCFGADRIAIHIEGNRGMQGATLSEKFSISDMIALMKKVFALGITRLECEGILEEGLSLSPNLDTVKRIQREAELDIIVSGGITTIKELELLHDARVYGVILDNALYERRIELKNAIELFDKGV